MSTNYVWNFYINAQSGVNIYMFEPYNNNKEQFDFVVPNSSNCYNFSNFESVNIIIKADSCVFKISDDVTFPRLNSSTNDTHKTRYQIANIEIQGNPEENKIYPTLGDGVVLGLANFNTTINSYNASIGSNADGHFAGVITENTYITKDMEITQTFGRTASSVVLYIKEGVTFTCIKNPSAPGLYFTKVYLGGTLTGDFQLFASLTCLTEDEKEIRGALKNANLTTNSSITIENIDIYNCTFTGSAIKIDNVTYPKREELPADMPPNTEDVEFPEGFIKANLNFPASAALRVTGPITGLANNEGYEPIQIGTTP